MSQREQYVAREKTGLVMEPKNSSNPEQTGAAGKPRKTQMLEDVEESMPAERYQANAESAISPLDETENFSLMLSRDEEMEMLRYLSILNPEDMDDVELLKDLRGLGKPPLFDGNDTDVSFFPVSEDDSILLRHMDDVMDTGPDEHHRAIGEMDNQMNQHIEMPQIQYTDKVADEFVAVQRQVSPRTTETKAPECIGVVAGKYQCHYQILLVRKEEYGKHLQAANFQAH